MQQGAAEHHARFGRGKKAATATFIAVAVAVLGIAVLNSAFDRNHAPNPSPTTAQVEPNVVGLDVKTATRMLTAAGLGVSKLGNGPTVTGQIPVAGAQLPPHSIVQLRTGG